MKRAIFLAVLLVAGLHAGLSFAILADREGLDQMRAEQLTGTWDTVKAEGRAPAGGFAVDYDGNGDGSIDRKEADGIRSYLLRRAVDLVERDGETATTSVLKDFDRNQDGSINASEAKGIREELGR